MYTLERDLPMNCTLSYPPKENLKEPNRKNYASALPSSVAVRETCRKEGRPEASRILRVSRVRLALTHSLALVHSGTERSSSCSRRYRMVNVASWSIR